MVDYKRILEKSPKPDLTLMQVFTDITGVVISERLIQKLLKQYDKFIILDGMFCLQGKQVEKPFAYLTGTLKNMSNKPRLTTDLSSTVNQLTSETSRTDRPVLRSPWNVAT